MAQPVDVEQLAADLNSAAIHLLRRIRSTDAALGVTSARLAALSVLVFRGPLSLQQLADSEQVAAPTMSKMVTALEHAGLVQREPDPDDGRAIRLTATPAGVDLMQRGRQLRIASLATELSTLSAADRGTLGRAAGILRALEVRGASARERQPISERGSADRTP